MSKEPLTTFFNEWETKLAQNVFRALNHKRRQQIMEMIYNSADPINVTDIYIAFKLEQSIISQHLKILRDAGLVISSRQGKFIYYSVNVGRIKQISEAAKGLQTCKTE